VNSGPLCISVFCPINGVVLTTKYQPKPEEILNIEGADNETLFWHLKSWLIADKEDRLQKRLDELWKHYKDINDQRLLALVGALCIETALDALLQGFISDYDSLKDDTDVTFSLKIKIAKALHLIPRKILNSCDLIRQIRNDFAHNLNLCEFTHLPKNRLNKLGPYVREFDIKERNSQDWVVLYRALVGFTTVGLMAYSYQIEALRHYLGTHDFRHHFKAYIEQDIKR